MRQSLDCRTCGRRMWPRPDTNMIRIGLYCGEHGCREYGAAQGWVWTTEWLAAGAAELECIGGPLDGSRWSLEGKPLLLVAWDAHRSAHVAAPVNDEADANKPMRRAALGCYRPNGGALRWCPR